MTLQKNYHWRIAGFYFFYFAFVGMFAPYWSLYLQSIHFNAMQIAVLMSVQPVMRMLSPTLWGWLADHTGKRLLVVQLAALCSVLSYLGVFFTTEFAGLLLVMMAMSFFWSASMPLVEATTLTYLGKHTARYGRIRSWGSVGFIVAVLGLGYAFDYIAIAWILWVGVAIKLGILLFARQIPPTEVLAHHTDSQPILRLVLQPQVLVLFGACFLMALAHGPYYIFYSIYLVENDYSKSAVGWLWALGVICEIAVFFAMPWLMLRFTLPKIMIVSFAGAVLRFLLIGWGVGLLPLMLFAQVLHAATFGAFHAVAMALVHQFFRGRHQSKGQALFGSITYGAGGMVGGLLSGPLWEHWGASVMYSISAVAALLGLLLILWKLRIVVLPRSQSDSTF
ncbi:MFS transporter [Candidatus Nitrotoga sp. 1052]|uniref:MFS transporter n=1 Tax=Candidatus Nitrotoga sp. 1052 TaxID=2886964 RepID=UPI001EF6584F|nr:MFS transporter [Candidatus Nitrotoga sp. 1052]CAH1078446.1 MFS transporter, PPP family, 3-phenylpropionic acid transporter [Candidatus Nitrotoga sp. 1052]